MYTIVKFLEENDAPGIISTDWINKDDPSLCVYPNVKTNEARDRLLKTRASPQQEWSRCRIKILHRYSNFHLAISHLRQAEDTSNLDSEHEQLENRPRKRKSTILLYPGEESEEEESESVSLLSSKSRKKTSISYPAPPSSSSASSIPLSAPIEFPSYPVPPIAATSAFQPALQNAAATSFSPSQTILNGKVISWMADISLQLQQLQSQVGTMLENQKQLLSRQHQQQADKPENDETFAYLGSLPVVDDGAFRRLDQKLSEDSHLRHSLMKVLISVGGKDMRSHAHNMLRKILTDEVAESYSLIGKRNTKKPFLNTVASRLIFTACKRVFKDTATDVKVKEAVGDWLHQAKVRKNRRMQRQEKDVEENEALLNNPSEF